MENTTEKTVLEFRHVSKIFPGVRALNDISFTAEGGRVCALLGENGAGKSTLLKILSGDYIADEGTLLINGEEKSFKSPAESLHNSVSVIYQERQLVSSLSVAENLFLEALPTNKMKFVKKKELNQKAQEIIDAFGLPIKARETCGKLSVAYQQMVEIMKSYRRNSRIIAFDEPTAPLTDREITILFDIIRKLKAEGKVVLYVSHRLAEIFQITDDIVVLKDGELSKTFKTAETTENELIKAMVGRDISGSYMNLSRNEKFGDVVLEVNNLYTDIVKDVSFNVRAGEIVGFSGLVGAGRTETMRAIIGADPIKSGEIKYFGKNVKFKDPADAIKVGFAYCPEDRKDDGLILRRSVKDNICMASIDKMKSGLFLSKRKQEELANHAIELYGIKTPSIEKVTSELSGGNQQKVILGRWMSGSVDTKVLILDEPTKGIDVRTKSEIYQLICDFAKQGLAVIFISSELTEILNVSDRIVVMHNGRVKGEIAREDATEENVLALAMLN